MKKSNWNGWQSGTDMLNWGGRPAALLAEHFLKLCNNFTAFPSTDLIWSIDMWANLSSAGAGQQRRMSTRAPCGRSIMSTTAMPGRRAGLGGDLVLDDLAHALHPMLPFESRYRKPDGTAAEPKFPSGRSPGSS